MVGGIIQLATYGSDEIYLTGNPEITYFRTVYRQHTNFAVSSIKIPFEDEINFGKTSRVTISRVGDLITKSYLELTIPSFYYERTAISTETLTDQLTEAQNTLTNINKFMYYNFQAYRDAYNLYLAENVTTVLPLKGVIDSAFDGQDAIIEEFDGILSNLLPQTEYEEGVERPNDAYTEFNKVEQLSILEISNNASDGMSKNTFMNLLHIAVKKCGKLHKHYVDTIKSIQDQIDDNENTNRKFAWVKKLGYAMIDYIQIMIGDQVVDKLYGKWMSIWNELTGNYKSRELLNREIGNVDTLTSYDRTVKPKYTLIIPLDFWFDLSTLAIPIVALQYAQINIELKLKKFSDCCYLELQESEDSINLDDIYTDTSKVIEGNICVEYVFLDQAERRKFAKSGHEYLITQLQMFESDEIENPDVYLKDVSFNHPCKELIVVVQKKSYMSNTTGGIETKNTQFSTLPDGTGNPIVQMEITLNGYTRTEKFDGDYYNYIEPITKHSNSPSPGINVYSFALKPEIQQPSGTCNFSRIKSLGVNITLDPDCLIVDPDAETPVADTVKIYIFAINMNVLRLLNGFSSLAYI